jgi:hypothetical protein
VKVPKEPRFHAKRVALVPGAPALLARNASINDPIVPLRAACGSAVSWLAELGVPIVVHCEHPSLRLAEQLIANAGAVAQHRVQPPVEENLDAVLVIGNGSACRSEKAPGFFDAQAAAYDERLGIALARPDRIALANLDRGLGRKLLADVDSLRWLGSEVLTSAHRSTLLYDDDPFGVQYWVMTWEMPDGV